MKKVVILLLISIFALPFTAMAHTTLTSSNPAEGELLNAQPEQIELMFGTAIEEGSTMTLKGPEASIELGEIAVSDKVMTGQLNSDLPNGQYTIDWKIIGEDGHPIEGQILFGVDIEVPQEEPSEEEAEDAAVKEDAAADEDIAATEENETAEAAETAKSDEGSGNVWVTVLIVVAIVLVAAGIFKLLKRRK